MAPSGSNDVVWWPEFCQPPEVLCGCCKQEFVSRTARPSKSQSRHPQDALEVSKEHLDLLSAMP